MLVAMSRTAVDFSFRSVNMHEGRVILNLSNNLSLILQDTVRLLVDKGARIDRHCLITTNDLENHKKKTTTPLTAACEIGRLDLVQMILADVNDKPRRLTGDVGREALHEAVRRGHLAVVEYLLDRRVADVDTVDNDGNSPLMTAIQSFELMSINKGYSLIIIILDQLNCLRRILRLLVLGLPYL